MKKKDKLTLHQSSIKELQSQIKKLSIQLVTKRQEIKHAKIKNLKAAKNIRLQIAIVKTIIRQKQLESTKANLETAQGTNK